MMDRAAFIEGLLGRPYRLGAQGPDAFDCWSLTRYVQEQLFGRTLAIVDVPAERTEDEAVRAAWWMPAALAERRRWTEVPHEEDGCLVTMTQAMERTHTGTWLDIDRGLVIHALPGRGVDAEPLSDMAAVGWGGFRFWRAKF